MDYQNFVFKLTPREIDQIITDVELHYRKFSFSYAIDTYDIINYCLPYTENIFNDPEERSYFAQRVIAYSHFFDKSINQVYVCQQYREEMKRASEQVIQNQRGLITALGENIDSILKVFERSPDKSDNQYIQSIRQNLELVVTLLILDKEYPSDNRKRHQFIKETFKKLNLEDPKYSGEDVIINELRDTEESTLTNLIFDSFVDESAIFLVGYNTRLSRYNYLNNSYLDIEVICRLSSVNRNLQRKASKDKHIVYYLSSATSKSNLIFDILNRISEEDLGLPSIDGRDKFNFHRNIFQVFLLNKLLEIYPDDIDHVKTILQLIKKINGQLQYSSLTRDQIESSLERQELEEFENIDQLLKSISTNIENHFYYEMFFKRPVAGKGKAMDPPKRELFELAYSLVKKEKENIDGFSQLVDDLSSFTNTQILVRLFLSADVGKIAVKVHYGLDIVKNSFHHLPYLIFASDPVDEPLASDLYDVLDTIAQVQAGELAGDKIILALRKIIGQLNLQSNRMEDKLKEVIILSWINLITVPIRVDAEDSRLLTDLLAGEKEILNREREILRYLEKYQHVFQGISFKPALILKDDILQLKLTKQDIPADVGYFILWLLRRALQFSACRELGQILLKAYPEDGRFYHGTALAVVGEYYATYYGKAPAELTEADVATRNDLIEQSISLLKAALAKYAALESTLATANKFRSLLIKSMIAVSNSLIDMTLRAYTEIHGMALNGLLAEARERLNQMKRLIAGEKLNYNHYPILNFTEAELEYYEALHYFRSNDSTNASVKILHATNRAYKVKETRTNMSVTFRRIINDIDALRITIFRAMKIIKN